MHPIIRRLCAASLCCLPLAGCLNSPDSISTNEIKVSAQVAAPATPCVGNQTLPRIGAMASTNESPALAAQYAIDGNQATRWSSAFADNQWLRIDLGAVRYINAITLRWEVASAQRYDLQVSNDGNSWKSIYTINWGQPGPVVMPFTGLNGRGRYLRVYAYTRTTAYGVSLYEVEAKGDPNGSCSEPSAVHIDAVFGGKSLDVKDWNPNPGAAIQTWGYGGGANQKWRLTSSYDGTYEIRSAFSNLCLDIKDWSKADGGALIQWECTGGANQKFTIQPDGINRYRIINVNSGKCLDIKDWNPNNGAVVHQWTCGNQDNQRWILVDPMDPSTDPDNCGSAGHSCLGGQCVDGACQAAIVANDFQCSSGMTANDQYFWVGDQGTLNRYDMSGYNKTPLYSQEPGHYFMDLQRNGTQFFWGDNSVRRLNEGQSTPATITNAFLSQLSVVGSDVVGYDFQGTRFASVSKDLALPGTPKTEFTLPPNEYPMYSGVTSSYIYYVTGNSEGSTVWQVNRATGTRKSLNGSGESIFGLVVFNGTAYWSYRTSQGASGIRSLSPLPGSTVQEAVPVSNSMQGVGNPMVDASGIYHSFYDGSNSAFYRTPLNNPAVRNLVSKGYTYPYDARYVSFTSNAIVWLQPCNRGGGGLVFKLAKP